GGTHLEAWDMDWIPWGMDCIPWGRIGFHGDGLDSMGTDWIPWGRIGFHGDGFGGWGRGFGGWLAGREAERLVRVPGMHGGRGTCRCGLVSAVLGAATCKAQEGRS